MRKIFLAAVLSGLWLPLSLEAAEAPAVRHFDFGTSDTSEGWTAVTPATRFSDDLGYGFEGDAVLEAVSRKKGDAQTRDFITSAEPFKFSVALPEGSYLVTVTLGDPEGTSLTTVKAEERRLMVERLTTSKKEVVTRQFAVNIRTPELSPGNEMKLDVREWDSESDRSVTATWDNRLTLRFSDGRPCVSSVSIEPADSLTTVFLIGDSTVTDQVTEPYGTWGQHLTRWFKPSVVIANHAESGQTAKGFRFQRRWDKVTDLIKPGDYVFIQFGHNDLNKNGHDAMWAVEDHAGNWINTYADALTDYKWFLASYALEVQRLGGIPVIVTPMTKMDMKTGEPNTAGLKEYPEGARQAAELAGCVCIDLNSMSVELASGLGAQNAPKAYVEGLHSNTYGGYLFARCIVEGIKARLPELAAHLTDDAGTFSTAHPSPLPDEFQIPADPVVSVPTPPGMKAFFNFQSR